MDVPVRRFVPWIAVRGFAGNDKDLKRYAAFSRMR